MSRSHLTLASLALLGVSCAYVPREVRLLRPEGLPTTPACVEIGGFVDTREDRSRVGVVRNGLGWGTASARSTDDVAAWLGDALRSAFAPDEPCTSTARIDGAISEVFVDEFWNLDGVIRVQLRVMRNGQVLLDRQLEGRHQQLSSTGSGAEFEETLRETLRVWVSQACIAIVDALRERPGSPGL